MRRGRKNYYYYVTSVYSSQDNFKPWRKNFELTHTGKATEITTTGIKKETRDLKDKLKRVQNKTKKKKSKRHEHTRI